MTLPADGTYTLALTGGNNPNAYAYSFTLTTPPVNTAAVTLGTEVEASLTMPGQIDAYTFAGTAGQRIYVNGLPGTVSVTAQLFGPSAATAQGIVYGETSFSLDTNATPYTLTETGIYTLRTTPQSSTGKYSFRVLDVASQPTLSVGTEVKATLDPGTSTALYRFTGTAGQRLFVSWQSASNSNGTYQIVGPDNTALSYYYTSFGTPVDLTLTASGTYLVVLAGRSTNTDPVAYQFTLTAPPSNSASLILGTFTSGHLATQGQIDNYTFTTSPGKQFYYAGVAADSNLRVTLLDPRGNAVALNGNSPDIHTGPFTLTEGGTYTLRLQAYNAATGKYSFRLLDASAQPTLAFNTTASGTLQAGAADLYQFTATHGQRVFLDWQASSNSGNYTVYSPSGQYIGNNSFGHPLDLTLAGDGTYVVVLPNTSADPLTYNFQLTTPPVNTATLGLTDPTAVTSGHLTTAGQIDNYTFTGSAGQRLYFDGLTGPTGGNGGGVNNGSINATLFNPDGGQTTINNTLTANDIGP